MLIENNQALYMDGVNLNDVANEYGTPVYVYSEKQLNHAFWAYQTAFSNLNPLICYAVKANGNLSLLQHIVRLGGGFDIVSGGELERVLFSGADPKTIVFSGVGKTEEEIEKALEADILCFNVESFPELDKINDVAGRLGKKAPISLRINPDVDAKTHPYISTGLKSNKFGIAYEDAKDAYLYAQNLSHLEIKGIDCHIGSQLTELAPLVEAAERMLHLLEILESQGIHFEHIDLGGGMGIQYKDEVLFELNDYALELERLFAGRPIKLILEPGRSIIGKAGVLLTRVLYVKQGEEKVFVVVDAGINDLMRPTLYKAYHEILPALLRDIPEVKADVVGPICESGDFLGHDRSIATQAGDVLVVKSSGAYAASMASNYNARCRAPEVLITDEGPRLIRRREVLADILATEIDYLKADGLSL